MATNHPLQRFRTSAAGDALGKPKARHRRAPSVRFCGRKYRGRSQEACRRRGIRSGVGGGVSQPTARDRWRRKSWTCSSRTKPLHSPRIGLPGSARRIASVHRISSLLAVERHDEQERRSWSPEDRNRWDSNGETMVMDAALAIRRASLRVIRGQWAGHKAVLSNAERAFFDAVTLWFEARDFRRKQLSRSLRQD